MNSYKGALEFEQREPCLRRIRKNIKNLFTFLRKENWKIKFWWAFIRSVVLDVLIPATFHFGKLSISSLMAGKRCTFCASSPGQKRAVLLSLQTRGNLKPKEVVVFRSHRNPFAQPGHMPRLAKLLGAPVSLALSEEL